MGSKPITINFSGMSIYLQAILRFTKNTSFWPIAIPLARWATTVPSVRVRRAIAGFLGRCQCGDRNMFFFYGILPLSIPQEKWPRTRCINPGIWGISLQGGWSLSPRIGFLLWWCGLFFQLEIHYNGVNCFGRMCLSLGGSLWTIEMCFLKCAFSILMTQPGLMWFWGTLENWLVVWNMFYFPIYWE